LDNKVFDIIDAWCNYEDMGSSFNYSSLRNCCKLSVIHVYLHPVKWYTVFPFISIGG